MLAVTVLITGQIRGSTAALESHRFRPLACPEAAAALAYERLTLVTQSGVLRCHALGVWGLIGIAAALGAAAGGVGWYVAAPGVGSFHASGWLVAPALVMLLVWLHRPDHPLVVVAHELGSR